MLFTGPTPLIAEHPALDAAAHRPWWRTSFPPPAVALAAPLPPVHFDKAKVVPDLFCGSLDGAKLEDGGVFLFGWAYDPGTGTPASAVIVLDSGRQVSPAVHVFRERPDVTEWMKSRLLGTSGWALWLPPSRLKPGKHVFEAYALFANGKLGRLVGEHRIESPGGSEAGSR
jgi:hypothetical protein